MNQTSDDRKNQANRCLREGATALASGHIEEAENAFRSALAIIPDYGPANHNLGLIRLRQGKAAEAEPFLSRAVHSMPSVATLMVLGECYEKLGQIDAAIKCFEPVLVKTPKDANLWSRKGELLERAGLTTDAAKAYQSALAIDPTQVNAAIKLGWILWRDVPSDALALLENALAASKGDLKGQVRLLGTLLLFREWNSRIDADLAPYHAQSLDDMFFPNAQETLLEMKENVSSLLLRNHDDHWARMTEGLAVFASGDLEGAQQRFMSVGSETGNTMAGSIRFDRSFFDYIASVSDAELLDGLPPVETVKYSKFTNQNVLYMCCDAAYFDAFTKPLLRSLAERGKESQVHIHLMGSPQQHTESSIQFCSELSNVETAISVERPDFNGQNIKFSRAYFHAIRFIRFYYHLQHYSKTLWLMDVDGLFNRPPDEIFESMGAADIAIRVRPGRLEPWNQFNACLVGATPSKAANLYIQRVSAYIAHFYRTGKLPWGIDQLAMYAAFKDLQKRDLAPTLHFLNEKVLDYSYMDEGILWCSSGSTKYTALNRKEVDKDLDASPFDREFTRYTADVS